MNRWDIFLVVVLLAAGCQPAQVDITHTYPSALPLPPVRQATVGKFQVAKGQPARWSDALRQKLTARIAAAGYGRETRGQDAHATATQATSQPIEIALSGRLSIKPESVEGKREILQVASDGRLSSQQVPTLVRTVTVRLDADIAAPGAPPGTAPGRVQVSRRYSSLEDPRALKPGGLGRIDDPANVPGEEAIIDELLGQCADELAAICLPLTQRVTVMLQPTAGAGKAAALMRQGHKDEAVRVMRDELARRKDAPDVLFNCATVEEAAGELAAARKHYEAALGYLTQYEKEIHRALHRLDRLGE